MTGLNFLWPRWADVVAHVRKKDVVSWKTIQKAAALLANRYGREQDARFARLAWEQRPRLVSPAWVRPPHRIRFVRHFLALAVALALASSSPAAADDQAEAKAGRLYLALGWASFAGAAGDFVSTEYALAAGGYELNALQQRRGVRIGSGAAFPFLVNHLTEQLRRDGHPKLALCMRIALVGLKGYAIAHNLRAGR